jgi:hypothetical protein
MSGFARAMRFAVAIMAVLAVTAASTAARAQTGHVHLVVVKAGFIVGVGGGHGTLYYNGARYHLRVGGIGIGSLGIARAVMSGTAHNLYNPADIAGTYGVAGAGGAFIGGPAVARLQNEKGVILELHGVQMGFQVSLGVAGMTIALR